MLPNDIPRCQGTTGVWADAVARGSLCTDCIDCRRRTEIVPGHSHTYISAPTWLPWSFCPQKIDAAAEVVTC